MRRGFLRLRKELLAIVCCAVLLGGSLSPIAVYADTPGDGQESQLPPEVPEDVERPEMPEIPEEPEEPEGEDVPDEGDEENGDNDIMPADLDTATYEVDGYTLTLLLSDDTCSITKITAGDAPSASLVVPKTVKIEGEEGEEQEYSITSITASNPILPDAVKTITLPESIDLSKCTKFLFWKCNKVEKVTLNGVSSLPASLFYNCAALQEVIINGDGDFSVGKTVFSGCNALKEVTIKGSNISLADQAFQNRTSLEKIRIDGNLVSTATYTFYGCSSLKELSVTGNMTSIPYALLYSCTALEKVNIGGNVDSIGNLAFCTYQNEAWTGLPNLKEVNIGGTLGTIGDQAFYNCNALTKVTGTGTTSIGQWAFYGCSALATIPDLGKATSIGTCAFNNLPKLTARVNLSSLNEITDYAFAYTHVRVTALSDELTSIGSYALRGATVDVASLPDKVTTVGDYALAYASFIQETFTLPDSLSSVGTDAFSNSIGVDTLYVGSESTDLTSLDADIFSGQLSDVYIAANRAGFTYNAPEGTTVHYKDDAESAASDVISDKPGAKTFQQAVNDAQNGDTIIIERNVALKSAVNIPANKNITIASKDGSTYTIKAGAGFPGDANLINVEQGAQLTLQNVKVQSRSSVKKSLINTNGKVTLGQGSVVGGLSKSANGTFKVASKGCGAIVVSGSQAELVLNGGKVQYVDVISGVENSAPICVTNQGTVTITSGEISDNTNYNGENKGEYGSAGILIQSGGKGTMSGGKIASNRAIFGPAINMLNQDTNVKSTFVLSGNAEISGNQSGETGAVYVGYYSRFTMDGGTIKKNGSYMEEPNNKGGGVSVVDWNLENGQGECPTEFIMNGGTITENVAFTGGGIYSASNGTVLKGGTISNNTAKNLGGGIYVEGNNKFYSTTKLYNVYVSSNTATSEKNSSVSGLGGGLWLCATGSAKIDANNAGVITGNTAEKAGNDVASLATTSNYTVTLSNRILGGGQATWYQDGVITGSEAEYPKSNGTQRYSELMNHEPITVENNGNSLVLQSVVSETDKTAAHNAAKLFITENSAPRGGGIAANGGISIGEPGTPDKPGEPDEPGGGGDDGGGDNPPDVPPTPPTPDEPKEEEEEEQEEEHEEPGERVEGNEEYGYYDEDGNWHFYDEDGYILATGDDSLMEVYAGLAALSLVVLVMGARKRIR